MARCDFASWDPISGGAGNFSGGPFRVVHHKTQGGLEGARAAYRSNRSDPHFTVHKGGVLQHVDTMFAARSLRNARGGVETNRDSAIQIEIVGFSGVDMDAKTMEWLVRLLKWIEVQHGVAWVWPEGRPPTSSATGYGESTGERHAAVWDVRGGHYGHSQVPENTHWDPAYTDLEWWVLNENLGAIVVTPTGGIHYMPAIRIAVVSSLKAPNGGVWLLQNDGAIYAFDCPYKGGANNQPYFIGRVAHHLEPFGDGYTIVAESKERYDYA